jgi:LmbE family N-acetylglucosaminyl deacetylase
MRVLHVHAHFDDFEFCAAGSFELWRRKFGGEFRGRVVVCTDGRSGHHFRSRVETAALRLSEQEASAAIGLYEFERLARPSGEPFAEARTLTTDLLAALWQAIRAFEPDYLICPPLPRETLAGIHPDHVVVAEAVRRVAYMINVPHAFLDEYPSAENEPARWIKTPVILNTHDGYMAGANGCDLAIDVEEVFEIIARESWCHQSQIREWLPWVGRHDMGIPDDLDQWKATLRRRLERAATELGLPPGRAYEVFTVTAWGRVPSVVELRRDLPPWFEPPQSNPPLASRLNRWSGG